MNKFIEAAAIAISSIMAHKLRSFLTLLGVIIGVAVVTAVATVIEGANVYIKEKIATLGSGVFTLQRPASPVSETSKNFLMLFAETPTSQSTISSRCENR
jgi:putative ABC transport system permease protein